MTWNEVVTAAPLFGAFAISVSVIVAFLAYWQNRRVARKRATLDMVLKTFLDPEGTKKYDDFKTIVRRHQDPADQFQLTDLVGHTPENERDRNTIIDQLNIYELISLGIRRKLFDEDFYKLWFHTQFTKDYKSAECYIEAVQAKIPSTYCEFKTLNERWQKNQHPVNHPGKLKMTWWVMTGNLEKLDAARLGMQTTEPAANTPSNPDSGAKP